MSRMNGFCALAVTLLLATPGLSRETSAPHITEEITVTATKSTEEIRNLSQDVRVIDKAELEASGAGTLDEVLQSVPGILVNRNGGPGSPVSIYLRGAKPGQTVVMVDGIEINDPMSTDRAVDLSAILLDAVERIEIVYGPASTVYGSDAMAGVINIITANVTKAGGTLRLETGSHGTVQGGFRWAEETGTLDWWIGGAYLDTDGISAASEADGNTEEDGYTNRTFNGGFNWNTGHGVLSVTGMVVRGEGDLDNAGGPFGDNPFYTFDRDETRFRADYTMDNPLGMNGTTRLSITTNENQRTYANPSADFPPTVNSEYNGRTTRYNWHNSVSVADAGIRFGLEHKQETGNSSYISGDYVDIFEKQQVDTDSAYVNVSSELMRFQWYAGLRYDDHETFGSKTTGSLGIVKLIADRGTRIRFHIGTAFKAPSLYQLFSPYGSTELMPEESTSWELGLEHAFMEDRMVVSLTYFDNTYDEMIDFDANTWTYINVAEAEIRGSEIAFHYRNDNLNWRLAYNFYHAEDVVTGERLLRRPRAAITGSLNKNWDRLGLHLGISYNTEREDLDFSSWPAARVSLESFLLLDVTLDYRINDMLLAYIKGHNVTDESYELVRGYGTLGNSWYAGVRFKLNR